MVVRLDIRTELIHEMISSPVTALDTVSRRGVWRVGFDETAQGPWVSRSRSTGIRKFCKLVLRQIAGPCCRFVDVNDPLRNET